MFTAVVAPPPTFKVVAVPFTKLKVVAEVVISPPLTARSPVRVVLPVTPRVVPTVAAPEIAVVAFLRVAVPDPLAPKVKVVAPVANEAVVAAPAKFTVVALVLIKSKEVELVVRDAPLTARVELKVAAPVTPRVVPTVAAPEIAVVAFLMVAVPVVAPRVNAVASPPIFKYRKTT